MKRLIKEKYYLIIKTEKAVEKENNVTRLDITVDLSETTQIIQWQ